MNGSAKATFRIAITALVLLATPLWRAAGAPQSGRPMENRFLFVIDTSSSMRSRTNGIEEAVAGLLATDMRGEFRKGDTIGVWTYDDQIHADFPMQMWSKENKSAITGDVLRYVRHQHYEKRAHLDKVLHAVAQIMERSERLTLIFIYDGTELIRGTQFDDDINGLQKEYARKFRSAHMPMVTIMATRNGQVFDYTINLPNSMTVPHTAIELPPPETNAPPAAVIAVAPPTNSAPVAPRPPSRRIEIVMSGTNSVTRTMTQAESAADNPAPAATNVVMTSAQQPQPPPATSVPAPIVAEAIAGNPPATTPTPHSAAPQVAAVTAQTEPAPFPAPTSPTVVPTNSPPSAPSTASAPPASPAPVISAPPESVPTPAPASAPALTAAPAPAPAPVSAASGSQQLALIVIAFSLLTIAVVLVVHLVRRSRGDAPASLISQSIDRGR